MVRGSDWRAKPAPHGGEGGAPPYVVLKWKAEGLWLLTNAYPGSVSEFKIEAQSEPRVEARPVEAVGTKWTDGVLTLRILHRKGATTVEVFVKPL